MARHEQRTFIFLAERRPTMTNTDLRPVAQDDRRHTLGPSRAEAGWTVRRAGVVAGVALLVMVALAAFADFVVVQGMLTPGDGPATAAEIVAREGTFRLGVLAWLLIVVLDVVIAWALYRVFRPVSPAVSMLAAVFRFAYAAVLLVAVGQLLRAVDVLTAGSTLPRRPTRSRACPARAERLPGPLRPRAVPVRDPPGAPGLPVTQVRLHPQGRRCAARRRRGRLRLRHRGCRPRPRARPRLGVHLPR